MDLCLLAGVQFRGGRIAGVVREDVFHWGNLTSNDMLSDETWRWSCFSHPLYHWASRVIHTRSPSPPPHYLAFSGLNSTSAPIWNIVFQFYPCPHGWPHPNLYTSDSSVSLFIPGFCQIPDQSFWMPPAVSLANSHSACLQSDSLFSPQEMVPLSLVSYGITISWQLITHQTWESLWASTIQ